MLNDLIKKKQCSTSLIHKLNDQIEHSINDLND